MLLLLLFCVAVVIASAEDLFDDIKADREEMWL
jgi:hypothetical protein